MSIGDRCGVTKRRDPYGVTERRDEKTADDYLTGIGVP
jgi:hypothetical protein